MMQPNKWKPWKSAKPRLGLFEKLINEVLDMVLREILLIAGAVGLLPLSLVSRHLYIHDHPHLYRTIWLDLNRASHVRLVHRLAHPESRMPRLIRELIFSRVKAEHAAFFPEISRIMAGLTHLTSLNWNGYFLDIPQFVLDGMYVRFPLAKLHVWASVMHLEAHEEQPSLFPLQLALRHSAARSLTSFTFVPKTLDQLYDKFKADIFSMLAQNSVLRLLKLSLSTTDNKSCPDMLETFRTYELPQPHTLELMTDDFTIFTKRELQVWGAKGGWQKMTYLSLDLARVLVPFVGLTPSLNKLYVDVWGKDNYDELEEYLDYCKIEHPFGVLREVQYGSYATYRGITPTQDVRIVP